MAFHQPTQSIQRAPRLATDESATPHPLQTQRPQQSLDGSQTWVLFSPATDITSASYLSETERSIDTPGRSRQSDLGSLNTVARSEVHPTSQHSPSLSALDEAALEDDAELDALDNHLPEFRSLPGLQGLSHHGSSQAAPVFPSHDGLGSFRLDLPGLGPEAQDQIYQFERFNPRRIRRRRESLEQVHFEAEPEVMQETEKRQRIESWRLEHSRVLLEEVQRETRRRMSQASSHSRTRASWSDKPARATVDGPLDDLLWHDEDVSEQPADMEGLLARFTRKVMTDIFGIDEHLLSIILGQDTLPELEEELSSTPKASQMVPQSAGQASHHLSRPEDPETWELRALARVSKELGLVINQFSHHPGAFSTYSRMHHAPLPYAGLPIIPETSAGPTTTETQSARPQSRSAHAEFKPSLPQRSQPINIAGREASQGNIASEDLKMSDAFTKEEWEQDLDVKLIFRYLRSRFSPHSNTSTTPTTSHLATLSAQEAAVKAARIRQHHPLVSRARPAERRVFKATVSGGSPAPLRHHSSCASQSTRRSARRSSVSSRHYWDLGGSLGTGSVVASHGPMGSWGEV